MRIRTFIGASPVVLGAMSGLALGDVFTDRASFEAAYPGLATQDFEGATGSQRDYTDFVLSSGAGGGTGVGTTDTNFPSRVAFSFFADDRIYIDFQIPVTAVGFEVASIHFFDQTGEEVEIVVYDAFDNVLETAVFDTAGRAMTTFIGFSNLGSDIARIDVMDGAGPEFVAIDNVTYGVPAPGAPLAVGALGALAAARRRRAPR